jgi:hypothetical protein
MIKLKSTSFSILLFMVIFLINMSTAFAHSGRTDASGCHTNRSTGEYHCHNGTSSNSYSNYSSSSSTNYEYQYKDNDHNGINDYDQDTNEFNQNLTSMGDQDGYQDAASGTYNLDIALSNLSNAEYGWYKLGYDEGYNRRKLEIVQNEARVEGYHLGLSTDEKVIPAKYTITKEVQELFENAFLKGQKEKWDKMAEEAASSLISFSIPDNLPQEIRESAQKTYDLRFEKEKKAIYEEGYASAFYNEELFLPNNYEKVPQMKELYEKGFHNNSEITTYNEQAYHEGKNGNTLDIPYEVSDKGGEELYRKHFEQGRKERNLKLGIIWFGIVSISIAIAIIYFYRKRKKALYIEQ